MVDFAFFHLSLTCADRTLIGMDSRAHRLGRGEEGLEEKMRNADVYEIDAADVVKLKERLLKEGAAGGVDTSLSTRKVVRVAGDVVAPGWENALIGAGFDPSFRTLWVLEGLVYYHTEDLVVALMETLRRLSAPGSHLCVSMVRWLSEKEVVPGGGRGKERNGQYPRFTFAAPEPEKFLERFGFQIEEVAELGGPMANFGRWPQGMLPCSNTVYIKCRTPIE